MQIHIHPTNDRSDVIMVNEIDNRYVQTDHFKAGLETRKSVLGAENVDRLLAQADDFNQAMQQLTTEYCWGAIWSRQGLPKKTRSLLNIAMLTALGKPKELETHVKGAFVNGCTVEEIQEVLLQAAIYCGVPAGVDAFRIAGPVVKAHIDSQAAGDQ
jgi:4-carboxymuconolactone decarboxylase